MYSTRFQAPESVPARPPAWVPDEAAPQCMNRSCAAYFEMLPTMCGATPGGWRHHCRCCGGVYCGACTDQAMLLPPDWESCPNVEAAFLKTPQRVCVKCEVLLRPHQLEWQRRASAFLENARHASARGPELRRASSSEQNPEKPWKQPAAMPEAQIGDTLFKRPPNYDRGTPPRDKKKFWDDEDEDGGDDETPWKSKPEKPKGGERGEGEEENLNPFAP